MLLNVDDRQVLENFRANLRSVMDSQNMSEAELALCSGFTDEQTMSDILHGEGAPNLAVPVRLARALRVPVEILLDDPKQRLSEGFEVLPVQDVDQQAARLLSAVFNATGRSLDRIGDRPTLDSIISWWKETDGDLSKSDQIAAHFDLVSAAEAMTSAPNVHHVGARGLSATMLGSAESSKLEAFLETLSTSDLSELNGQIKSVAHSGIGMITAFMNLIFSDQVHFPVSPWPVSRQDQSHRQSLPLHKLTPDGP